ncbi:hypothetical protein GGS23DRAFT_589617 [Durotheca rogersii]|uniref:uncharacterized protein n=1 Tax=Durotheca rogersii TaxID=419775 RepID=UPI002220A3FE|nr:uncharacterized protein GGS23DRAFT_589617 [Durotheca rogersii]KAI5855569.1 hypothetical protein GGS23DRAFT_589617 [Durotheca rogersii]
MSAIRISLDNPPEFYTNLDYIRGRVILTLHRLEVLGNVIVKLEGESRTALTIPPNNRDDFYHPRTPGVGNPGNIETENHKILYRVYQAYPEDGAPVPLQAGQHEFNFSFKLPLNNICHDSKATGSLLGMGGISGPAGALGMAGGRFRTIDGTRQLMLKHVKTTLPPSLTGFPQEAEIRYYIKVTIQRPGFFKENWRHQIGFKFFPIEPPRPVGTNQEAFARRPFAFRPYVRAHYNRKSLFSSRLSSSIPQGHADEAAPSVEMSARIPFPSILTCNGPLPLRLIARKLVPTREVVYLTSLEISLIGYTQVRVHDLQHTERTTWVLLSAPLNTFTIALGSPDDPVDTEFEVPSNLWRDRRLPNTVAPSFRTCNLARRYEIEVLLTLSWRDSASLLVGSNIGSPRWTKGSQNALPQTIQLPLKLSRIDVFSGIKPPQELLDSVNSGRSLTPQPPPRPVMSLSRSVPSVSFTPQQELLQPHQYTRPAQPNLDPLYPPQLGTEMSTLYNEAPPSYDEAMADRLAGPSVRPEYSGMTVENWPSSILLNKS